MGDLFDQFEAFWAVSERRCGFTGVPGLGGWVEGFRGFEGLCNDGGMIYIQLGKHENYVPPI